jgi:putative flippase GtrA
MKREFLLYAAVSVLALAIDILFLYIAAVRLAVPGYLAAALAYATGLIAHYLLSVRYVFAYRRLASQRRTELLVYALTGVLGIVLSAGIVHLGSLLGQSLAVSKLAAIAVSFVAVFMARKATLFSPTEGTRSA